MEEIGLEEWKYMIKMGALTRGYIGTPSVEKEIAEFANSCLQAIFIWKYVTFVEH